MSEIPARRLSVIDWLICVIAAIGFTFDIYELLMLPLVLPPALLHFTGATPGTPEFRHWFQLIFLVPAFCGGILGLLGGYLTDLFGRRRVLTWSILLYAFSAFAAGFSTSPSMLLALRCLTFAGVCVEFVAAVAWLAELFPNPRQREQVLGYTQAFSSLGGILAAFVYGWLTRVAPSLPAIAGGHDPWRYMLISGVLPALPLILIRPFLPESPAWQRKREEGTLRRPSLLELFAPTLRRTTIITTLMVACSYGVAFGAIQQLSQIVPTLPGVRDASPRDKQAAVAEVSFVQELGGAAGRLALALLAVEIVSRQRLIRSFQVPALLVLPVVFGVFAIRDLRWLEYGIFVVGFLAVAQFSFWGNYLPRVYPLHLRGTGESFAANVGGRILGTSCVLLTQQLAPMLTMAPDKPAQIAYASAIVGTSAILIGLVLSFWLPEPRPELLAD